MSPNPPTTRSSTSNWSNTRRVTVLKSSSAIVVFSSGFSTSLGHTTQWELQSFVVSMAMDLMCRGTERSGVMPWWP
jgi:hypothetical protein